MTMEAVLAQGVVAGLTFYRMHAKPAGGCAGDVGNADKGCVVAEVFAGLNDRAGGAARAAAAARVRAEL